MRFIIPLITTSQKSKSSNKETVSYFDMSNQDHLLNIIQKY